MNKPSEFSLDMAIRTILEKGSSSLGDEFFHVMAKELAQILNADFTLIGTLSESDEGLIDTVSFCAHGEQQSNFGYELAGTPCDEVIGHKICHFPEGVADLFPEDLMLADNGIEGYVGVPLFDTRGKPLGLMAALYCEPIENEEFPSAVMFVFAQRIAAEIERLALAAERRQFETQMSHTQKLESIGVMAGGIADDFNNLLCGILGSADLVAHKIGEDHEANENLQMITKTAQSASELCSPILAYSGKGRCAIEPLNATVVLEEMSDLLEMSVSNNVRIVRALDNALPRIEADRSQIQQIIFNLVVNGSEAIGEDSGTITIVTGAMDCSAEYLSTTYLEEGAVEGSYVFVEISDTGSGLEQQALERLFDPFFTTKLTGRGLGLAATLEIIRGHKGSIKAYSEVGRGTTFRVLFPASSQEPIEKPVQPVDDDEWHSEGKVLLIEDDDLVRNVARRIFESFGFGVVSAVDGVENFSQDPQGFKLVLMDLTMPRMSGEETFRELRLLCHDVKVILTSSFNEQHTTNQLIGKCLAGFVPKPLRRDQLRDRIRDIIES